MGTQPMEMREPCRRFEYRFRALNGQSTYEAVVLAADRASIAAIATNTDDRERATVDTEQSVDVGEDDAQKAQEGIASSRLSLWCNQSDLGGKKLRIVEYVRW